MLNIFRRRETIVRLFVGAILVMVSLAMVITLIPGLIGTASDPLVGAVVAEVGGEQITAWELQQNLSRVSRVNQIPADLMPLYAAQLLDQMVLDKAILREANRLGFRVEESEVRERLRQDPGLFPGGTFVGQQQYEDIVFNTFGMTVAQYEKQFRDRLLGDKLRRLVTDPVTVTPEEIQEAFHNENEKLVLSYVFLEPATFRKDIAVSDAVLETYYEGNKARYQIPEKRSAKILLVEKEKVRQATTVADAEIRKYYEEYKDSYRQPERVQVSHILLKAPEEDKAKVEEAKKKAEELVEKLKEGADFAAVARENSGDEASASQGGDLGWIVRDQTVPAFEKAAFDLPPGTTSDPIQTVYGIHILKVRAHEPARVRPVEEARPMIEVAIRDEKTEARLTQAAEQAAADLRRSPNDIEALAAQYQGTVLTPPPFAQDQAIDRIGVSQQGFLHEIFGLEKGQVSLPIPVAGGHAIALLLDVFPAHQGELDDVRKQVGEDYVDEQAREKAISKAEELRNGLEQQKKKDLRQAARTFGLTVNTTDPVTRSGSIPSLGSVRDLGPEVFTLEPGEVAGPIAFAGGQVIYQLDSRQAPQEEDLEAQREPIRQRLLREKQSLVLDAFQNALKNRLIASGDLKVHSDALSRFVTAGSALP